MCESRGDGLWVVEVGELDAGRPHVLVVHRVKLPRVWVGCVELHGARRVGGALHAVARQVLAERDLAFELALGTVATALS